MYMHVSNVGSLCLPREQHRQRCSPRPLNLPNQHRNSSQLATEGGLDSVHLADLLPDVWADFIRNADMSDVRPLGTRAVEVVRQKFGAAT